MRIFTAIPLPQAIKDQFLELTHFKLPISYVNPENLHITLNFLGELDTDRVKKILETWTNGLSIPAFNIEFDGLGKFGQQLHLTVRDNPTLMKLQDHLIRHFQRLGFNPTYGKYHPHVTIGKMNMDKVMTLGRKIENFPHEELSKLNFTVDRIVLYESKLLLHHPKYIEMAEYKLHS